MSFMDGFWFWLGVKVVDGALWAVGALVVGTIWWYLPTILYYLNRWSRKDG